MAVIPYDTLVGDFSSKMDDMTQTFLSDNYHILASYMATPIALMSTLYLVIMGYLVLMGTVKMDTRAFLKMAFTIGFVNLFALNWLYFSDFFVGLFLTAASEISSLGSNSHFFQFPHLSSTGSGINDGMQTVLTESVHVGMKIMGHGGYTNWLPLSIGLFFILCGATIVALALIEVSMIKFFICLLLSTAPLFISFYLFEETKSAFKTWLSLLAGFSFALIFVGMTIGMAMNWMHWVVGDLYQTEVFDLRFYTTVPLIFVSILALIILFSVVPLAKQIGGAMGSGSHTGGVIGTMSSIAQKSILASKGMNNLYNKWKNK